MSPWTTFKPAQLAAFAAVLVIPFYVGLVHWRASGFFLYAAVASVAIAVGEHFDTTPRLRGRWTVALQSWLLWFLTIAFAGGLAYLIAWLF